MRVIGAVLSIVVVGIAVGCGGGDSGSADAATIADAPGPPPDATGTPLDATPPDAGCPNGMKLCGGSCVSNDDPAFGCLPTTCTSCDVPQNHVVVCSAGACLDNGCAPNTWDIDGNPLTGCEYTCVMTASTDPIDPGFVDENCDGGDGMVEACVYVSPTIGNDITGNGTRAAPLATIAVAIGLAQLAGVPAVCLSGELYQESVSVVSGISVYGGFDHQDPDFAFRRSIAVTTTVRAAGTVFYAPFVDAPTHVEGMTIDALGAGAAGGSTYAVRLGGGTDQLFVRYNTITVAAGVGGSAGGDAVASTGAALPGNPGQSGASGSSNGGFGGNAPACAESGGAGGRGGFDTASGQAGFPGTGNAPVGSGGASVMCFGGGNAGTGGGTPQAGGPGAAGVAGAAIGGAGGAAYAPADGAPGTTGLSGRGGSGGGGGGGGEQNVVCNADRGGGGGSGGCGGLGGDPGQGGGGGGGSFAVFVAAGMVVVTGNEIVTGAGGGGGAGGNGVLGQPGGIGGGGGGGADDAGPGGPGGAGSSGGAGGGGGGGGGGPSACLARTAAVTFTFASNSCTVGVPGIGGAGGGGPIPAGNGSNGSAGPNLLIP